MADYPPILPALSETAYRAVFEKAYCVGPIMTFDGIEVRFKKSDFDHCCFESSKRDKVKDKFSQARAERLLWIKAALEDPSSQRFQGWDRDERRYDPDRRVTVVQGDFVVVIGISKAGKGRFITAYRADSPDSLSKILGSPKIP